MKSVLFFFFSSRRRHTRYIGDWSSDVCSSDLGDKNRRRKILRQISRLLRNLAEDFPAAVFVAMHFPPESTSVLPQRSEERRVGKECRIGVTRDLYRNKPSHY